MKMLAPDEAVDVTTKDKPSRLPAREAYRYFQLRLTYDLYKEIHRLAIERAVPKQEVVLNWTLLGREKEQRSQKSRGK